eukprot:TRINITY_DN2459_c0_g2_i3.p1 TRINITY_DN2459_c0_g2~~TRINITY_DN2459_c0_g2_i3.p1  ORF type:complete len:529 (+),score=81.92 TRINITY_DN2459_c0_g2_i3:90-1676(+)
MIARSRIPSTSVVVLTLFLGLRQVSGQECVSQRVLTCINGKSRKWPKCDPSQSKTSSITGPFGYEYGFYCTQNWTDALNDMLSDPAVNKCNDRSAIHKMLAHVAFETGYFSTVGAWGGGGLIWMIPEHWPINAADMDALFPNDGQHYEGIAAALQKDFFQSPDYGWKSVAAWFKLTNRVLEEGCGADLFDQSLEDQTKCILNGDSSRQEEYDIVDSCLPPATTTTTTAATTTTSTTTTTSSGTLWAPVDGGNGRACRGATPQDNQDSYYRLITGVDKIEDCQAKCTTTLGCIGIEHSPSGRCEVWTRKGGIQSSIAKSGYTCLQYQGSVSTTTPGMTSFEPVDGGDGRACRGKSVSDNSASYYTVYRNTASLDDCKSICLQTTSCTGIEFASGRCEVWTYPISASRSVSGYMCLRFTTTCVPAGGKCGGRYYNGPDCCVDGYTCIWQTEWYSQCKPSYTSAPNYINHTNQPSAALLADISEHTTKMSSEDRSKKSKRQQMFLGTAFIQDGVSLKRDWRDLDFETGQEL